MKKVLNKLLTYNYDYCRNCIFNSNCTIIQCEKCSSDDQYIMNVYNMCHIYVKDEKSSK